MATRRLSAQIPDRELHFVAWKLGMLDCTNSEIGKAIILTGAGYTPEQARAEVLALRKTVQMSDANSVRGFYVPELWLDAAMGHENTPKELSVSERFRFWCARLTDDYADAVERAKVRQGRPPKSREVAA